MTRIDVPRFDAERRVAEEARRIRLRPGSPLNDVLRGQQARNVSKRTARLGKKLGLEPEEPDALEVATAEARIARQEAQVAQAAAEAATARQAADDAAARLAEAERR